MVKKRVYLSGPMDEDETWRREARSSLQRTYSGLVSIEIVEPSFLEDYRESYGLTTEEAAKVLTARDRDFAMNSDYMLVNFEGATRRSMGTCIELGWANANGTIIVTVMPELDNPHVHPIVKSVSDFIVSDLSSAIHLILALSAD